MWRWASCSRVLPLLLAVAAASPAAARLFLSQDQALERAFGTDARVERQVVFLTPDQVTRAREAAGPGVEVASALVTRYAARAADGTPLGTAYFDTHRVRTLQETLMIVLGPDGTVTRLEVLAFGEPEEYLGREKWLAQYRGRPLDRDLALGRGIHGITGATLTARAVTQAVRRTLAIHAAVGSGAP